MKCQVKVEINTTGTELGGSEAVRLNKLKTTKEPLQTKPAARYTSSCPGNTRKKHKNYTTVVARHSGCYDNHLKQRTIIKHTHTHTHTQHSHPHTGTELTHNQIFKPKYKYTETQLILKTSNKETNEI